jgi:hypothetical protein
VLAHRTLQREGEQRKGVHFTCDLGLQPLHYGRIEDWRRRIRLLRRTPRRRTRKQRR